MAAVSDNRRELGAFEDNAGAQAKPAFNLAKINQYFEQPLFFMAVFLIFVVAWYMNWGTRRGPFGAIRFEFMAGWFLLLSCSMLISSGRIKFAKSRPLLISAAVLLVLMVVQVPFAADTRMANFVFFDRGVFKFTMLTFFIIVMVQSPRTFTWFILAFLFACFYVTQESVQGLISGGLYWENQGVMRLHGSVRMYAHPNSLAGLAMGAIPFVIFLFPVIKSKIVRLAFMALFCTSLTCVIYSGSRTAYVAIVAFLLFWWGCSRHKVRFFLIGCAALVVAYPAIPQQYKERFTSISGQEAEGHSKESRLLILEDAMDIFLANPGGIGLASFPAVRLETFGRKQDTHNLYFEIATNMGVQGLIAFLVFIYFMFKGNHTVYKTLDGYTTRLEPYLRRRGVPRPLKKALSAYLSDVALMIAATKAVAGFVFVRLMLGFFGMDMYEIYWWFALGLSVALLNLLGPMTAKAHMLSQLLASSQEKPK